MKEAEAYRQETSTATDGSGMSTRPDRRGRVILTAAGAVGAVTATLLVSAIKSSLFGMLSAQEQDVDFPAHPDHRTEQEYPTTRGGGHTPQPHKPSPGTEDQTHAPPAPTPGEAVKSSVLSLEPNPDWDNRPCQAAVVAVTGTGVVIEFMANVRERKPSAAFSEGSHGEQGLVARAHIGNSGQGEYSEPMFPVFDSPSGDGEIYATHVTIPSDDYEAATSFGAAVSHVQSMEHRIPCNVAGGHAG